MKLERITDANHPMYKKARELYEMSFPIHEQRVQASQKRVLQNEAYHFDIISDGENFVGEILYWQFGEFYYIEHFCISPEKRNMNYGRKTLELLEKESSLILEIDPPIDAVSNRRKCFYVRCGFAENSYRHIHPPYRRQRNGHELVVMSYPHILTQNEYDSFNEFLKNTVMENVFD